MSFQQENEIRNEDLSLFQMQSGILDGSTDEAHWSRIEAGMLDGQVLSGETSLQDEQGVFDQALDPLDISSNSPQLKVPSAMGIMLARALGVDAVLLFYIGRFANMLYAALLVILRCVLRLLAEMSSWRRRCCPSHCSRLARTAMMPQQPGSRSF